MERIKLFDYQLDDIRNRLDATYNQVEDDLCHKYNVCDICYLNATDYDKIMSDIEDLTNQVTQQRKV